MICEACGKNEANQIHHKFGQGKLNRKLYGDLIDNPLNFQKVCSACGVSHAGLNLIHWSEKEFCEALGIFPLSKSGLL